MSDDDSGEDTEVMEDYEMIPLKFINPSTAVFDFSVKYADEELVLPDLSVYPELKHLTIIVPWKSNENTFRNLSNIRLKSLVFTGIHPQFDIGHTPFVIPYFDKSKLTLLVFENLIIQSLPDFIWGIKEIYLDDVKIIYTARIDYPYRYR